MEREKKRRIKTLACGRSDQGYPVYASLSESKASTPTVRGTMAWEIALGGVIAYVGPRVYETEGRRAAESTMPTYHFIKLDPKIKAQCLKLILGCIFEK